MAKRKEKAPDAPPLGPALAVSSLALLTFLPSLRGAFLDWDDDLYILRNTELASTGLRFFKSAATAVVAALWHPLTLASYRLDHAFWGLDPFGYHLTNVVLHALNAGLVFLLAANLLSLRGASRTKSLAAAAAALLFGLHPLRVESVAWVSERKDVLCGFFYLASALAYLGRRLSASLVLFALALLSKPMAVSLPIALLLLDYGRPNEAGERPPLAEKVPFFALSLLGCASAFWAQAKGAAVVSTQDLPLATRLGGAARALAFYIQKTILPTGLAPLYPWPPKAEVFGPAFFGALALLAGITTLCVLMRRKNRAFLAAWLYWLVSLAPVIGLVQVGSQFAADRYTYLPSLGPALLAGAGIASLFERLEGFWKRAALTAVLGALLSLMTAQTVRQEAVWKDSLSLWTQEVRLYPEEPALGHFKSGTALQKAGRIEEAARELAKAVRLSPGDHEARNNLGALYMNLGRPEESAREFQAAVTLKPDFLEAHYNLGVAFKELLRLEEAVREYKAALALRPDYLPALNNLGEAYMKLGRAQDAATEYSAILKRHPEDAVAHYNLGAAYRALGRAEAAAEFKEALKLAPDFPQARKALGGP